MEKPIGSSAPKERGIETSRLVLILLIAALSSMFIALSIAYAFSQTNWTWHQFRFPKTFLLSTIVIVASSFTLSRGIKELDLDHLESFHKWIKYTLWLGVTFLLFQILGWYQLNAKGIFFNGKPDGSYLYLISGLHALHLVVGVVILVILHWKAKSSVKNPVDHLLLASDVKTKKSIRLLATYWHFVDVLWLYLLLFFLFNHL